mmetsp:Transcript_26449/g.38924  ORF Transcript_26449/g.38924 Transcript_26449/m.38924 type:complete len:400 (-) Transcript_26449:684-1883(-)
MMFSRIAIAVVSLAVSVHSFTIPSSHHGHHHSVRSTAGQKWSDQLSQSRHTKLFQSFPNEEGATSQPGTEGGSQVIEPELSSEDMMMVSGIYAVKYDEKLLQDMVSEALPRMHPRLVMKLRQAASYSSPDLASTEEEKKNIMKLQTVGKALEAVLDSRLQSGRDLLKTFLDAGEIRKLDGAIGKAARNEKLDMAFFTVLNMNIRDAAYEASLMSEEEQGKLRDTQVATPPSEDGEGNTANKANRLQILQHIYTRCQEEMEKAVPPGIGLLNKLLRTEIPSIRSNQIKHYLTPQPLTVTTPDGKTVELKGDNQKSLVSIAELVSAMEHSVRQIRTVENAGGTDRRTAAGLVENTRQVAMEARFVIGTHYGPDSDEVQELEDGLQPVFRPENQNSQYIKGD